MNAIRFPDGSPDNFADPVLESEMAVLKIAAVILGSEKQASKFETAFSVSENREIFGQAGLVVSSIGERIFAGIILEILKPAREMRHGFGTRKSSRDFPNRAFKNQNGRWDFLRRRLGSQNGG